MFLLSGFYGIGLPIVMFCVCQNRGHLKDKFNIGNVTSAMNAEDYFLSCCCTSCTICQHGRELQLRGFGTSSQSNRHM